MSSKGFVIQSKCYCAEVSYDSNINNIMHILRRIVSLDGSFGPVGRGPWFSTVQTVGGGGGGQTLVSDAHPCHTC